jgi:plasmid stabilization system protein ParE
MDYKVIITDDAEADLDCFISYLLFVKKSQQAASNVLDDFEQTKNKLSHVAGSLKDCENPRLQKYGYKRINFLHHRYFMLYRIDGDTAIVDNIFHDLQDYEHKLT